MNDGETHRHTIVDTTLKTSFLLRGASLRVSSSPQSTTVNILSAVETHALRVGQFLVVSDPIQVATSTKERLNPPTVSLTMQHGYCNTLSCTCHVFCSCALIVKLCAPDM